MPTLRIRDVETATPRAMLVHVELGDHGFDYAAGQAVLVAPHGVTPRRPYSIASAPEDAKRSGIVDLLIGIDGGDGEAAFEAAPGALLDVDGPVGSFTFPENPPQRHFLFIAGGTGIAPLRAMLRHALGIPHDRIGLFYSARAANDFAFEAELRALAAAGAIDFRQTVTRDGGTAWTGPRGRLTIDTLRDLAVDVETLCFVCGPASMVEDVPTLLQQAGGPRGRIRSEEWQQTG